MENKLTRWFVYKWEKPTWQKPPLYDFKVITPENPLLLKQTVTSKGILVPYTNLQLNPYPNTQLDLFFNDNSPFQCTTPSTWLTNRCTGPSTYLIHQLEKNVGCKVFQFIHTIKIKKLLVYKTLRRINAVTSSRERWIRAYVSGHNMLAQNLCIKWDDL